MLRKWWEITKIQSRIIAWCVSRQSVAST
jgi:hypothetical protein